MPAEIIDGRKIARVIRESLKMQLQGIYIRLGIICSDVSPASVAYRQTLVKLAESLGIQVIVTCFEKGTPQGNFEMRIHDWNKNPDVHGIFVLQPLFNGVNPNELRALIHPFKDIECVHPYDSSFGYFSTDHVGSCTAMAIMEVLKHTNVPLEGAEVTVVGHSSIVGKPVSEMLIEKNATVTTCNKATSDRGLLQRHVEQAEILVVAAGKPNFIPGHWIKEGAVVIDVGVNDIGDEKIVGDVEFESALARASFITPPIGGVGPVTAIIGMRQLFIAYTLQKQNRS